MRCCVVFDVDDTLYLERDYVRSGFRALEAHALERLGIERFSERAWALFESGVRHTIFNTVLEEAGVEVTTQRIRELVERYRGHRPSVSLLADAHDCLEALRQRAALAAITDGPVASQRAKVEALDLARWLDPIVLTGELGPGFGKPHPRAFALVEQRVGVPGTAFSYVADNPGKDFRGPKQRGWTTIRVRRRGGLHADEPSGPDVDHELASLDAIPQLLSIS